MDRLIQSRVSTFIRTSAQPSDTHSDRRSSYKTVQLIFVIFTVKIRHFQFQHRNTPSDWEDEQDTKHRATTSRN